jgi:hypothetical protein
MRVGFRNAMRVGLTALCVSVSASPLFAQAFKLGDKEVQLHGSFQQGFAISDTNNFLTMNTDAGSGEMTDFAFNASSNVTRKLRVGGQMYVRKIGELGEGQVQIDWAYADYRFAKAIGVRAGKMKTMLGLFNDTQDMEFLHTWALLPQGVYALDLRAVTIAHVGADVYGTVGAKKVGSVDYTVHYGSIPDDMNGGYRYGTIDSGMTFSGPIRTKGYGADVRWSAPIDGLIAGYSMMSSHAETNVNVPTPARTVPVFVDVTPWTRQSFFADYQHDALHVSGELRKDRRDQLYTPSVRPNQQFFSRGYFASASYRFAKQFEAGSYISGYVPNTSLDASLPKNHETDRVITGRFDINRFLNVKVEGHFIDGYGTLTSSLARGFYLRDNPEPSERTNMLVIRAGVNF